MIRLSFRALAIGCLLALAGCGGDDGGGPDGQAGGSGGSADSFTTMVSQIASTSLEDVEPADVDRLAPSQPEATEPAAL
ncbi:MAG: hypothetical protein AB7G48_03000 [Nitrospiraceae bacterium]